MAKLIYPMPSSVERRIAAWQNLKDRLGQPERLVSHPTITLSRMFGCQGYPLAESLQHQLEKVARDPWLVYDRALLEAVHLEEKVALDALQNLGAPARDIEVLGLYGADYLPQERAFEKVSRVLLRLAKEGNAIIIGRGGAILCAEMANCYHFRLEASLEFRAATVAEHLKLSLHEARHLVEVNSRHQDRFIRERLGKDGTDRSLYDGVFNNEHHSIDEIAAAILAYLRQSWPDKSYFRN